MQVKKQRIEFLNLLQGLGAVGSLSGFKISYAILRIKNVIRREEKKAVEITQKPKVYEEYDLKRNELAKSYARKDPLGKPLQMRASDGRMEWDIPEEDRAAFDKDFEDLKAENKEAFEAKEKHTKEVNDFLTEEITLDLYDIKKSDLPENITVDQIDVLSPFIVDLEQ